MNEAAVPGNVRLKLHVQPGAARTEVVGWHGDAIKIRLAAPPVDGRANDELLRFLSTSLGVARSSVGLLHGLASRSKLVSITGLDMGRVLDLLGVPHR